MWFETSDIRSRMAVPKPSAAAVMVVCVALTMRRSTPRCLAVACRLPQRGFLSELRGIPECVHTVAELRGRCLENLRTPANDFAAEESSAPRPGLTRSATGRPCGEGPAQFGGIVPGCPDQVGARSAVSHQSGCNVDGQRQDDGVEQKAEQSLHHGNAAELARGNLHIGNLECHAKDH
jgi:hypothetical protein